MPLPLSVLDLSPVGVGITPSQAIRDSIELARTADRLGYTRYWVAEHHNMASIATSAPEVLIAHIAAVTTRIRVLVDEVGGSVVVAQGPAELRRAVDAWGPVEPGAFALMRALRDEFDGGRVLNPGRYVGGL